MIFIFSCATRNTHYDRNEILEKYSANYKILVDNHKIDLGTIYLDKDNIEKVQINKQTKELKITQFNPAELFELKNLNLDRLSAGRSFGKKKIELIVIDGILITDSLKERTKIDPNAIQSITILSQEKMNNTTFCKRYDGDVLLIATK